jgi:hypothetical protein
VRLIRNRADSSTPLSINPATVPPAPSRTSTAVLKLEVAMPGDMKWRWNDAVAQEQWWHKIASSITCDRHFLRLRLMQRLK